MHTFFSRYLNIHPSTTSVQSSVIGTLLFIYLLWNSFSFSQRTSRGNINFLESSIIKKTNSKNMFHHEESLCTHINLSFSFNSIAKSLRYILSNLVDFSGKSTFTLPYQLGISYWSFSRLFLKLFCHKTHLRTHFVISKFMIIPGPFGYFWEESSTQKIKVSCWKSNMFSVTVCN